MLSIMLDMLGRCDGPSSLVGWIEGVGTDAEATEPLEWDCEALRRMGLRFKLLPPRGEDDFWLTALGLSSIRGSKFAAMVKTVDSASHSRAGPKV